MMEKGKLIVIEGACDGIGKTLQTSMLKEHLEKDGISIVMHHFPSYNTDQGKLVEKYLNGDYGSPKQLSPYFINSLYAVDRAITWQMDLKKDYEEGKTILLDRYTTSSLIYQGALLDNPSLKKKFIDYVCDFEYGKLEIKRPDKVIFLYAPFDLVTKIRNARKNNDGVSNDVHERDIEYMRKVYDNAMFVADYLRWEQVKCDELDHMLKPNEVHDKVYQLVKKI